MDLQLETGGAASLPRDLNDIQPSVRLLRNAVKRAVAMGSPMVRTLIAGDRDALPKGVPMDKIIETMIQALPRRPHRGMDAGLKLAIENHKELLCWQTRQVIEGAGKEFVGSYMDTGNPVFVMEDPMETVETLGPLAVTFHLRDSVIYETRNGDRGAVGAARRGRRRFQGDRRQGAAALPQRQRLHQADHRPQARRHGVSRPAVDAGLAGREGVDAGAVPRSGEERTAVRSGDGDRGHPRAARPEPYQAALQYQQKEHMERSVEYGKKVLDLGIKWRS